MTDVRNEHGFGRIHSYAISQPRQANFIEAKFNISRVLDIPDQLCGALQGTGVTQLGAGRFAAVVEVPRMEARRSTQC